MNDEAPLRRLIETILAEIDARALNTEAESLAQAEKLSRALGTHLKTLTELRKHNAATREQNAALETTPYDQLPPIPSEDRDRLFERLLEKIKPYIVDDGADTVSE